MADKTVVVRIALKGQQFSQGLRQAAGDTQKFATDVSRGTEQAASSAINLGAASALAGKMMVLGIGGAMVVSAAAAIEYQSSLTGVAKTTDLAGETFATAGSELATFGQAMRNLSLDIPINVNELNRIAELGGQLGVGVPDLVQFTDTIAKLGVTTNLATEEAATGLARFANIMGTDQTDFGRLGDIIVELGNNFAATESEILKFATRIAPVGRTVGATEEEVFALATALTSLGVPAERGGTAIQRLFIDMADAIDQGSEDLETFARVAGMTSDEFAELFGESPARAFQEFARGLDGVSDSGGSAFQVLRELGINQQRSVQVLLAAASGWETVADAIDTANVASAEGVALEEEAALRFGTTASELQLLANAFNDLRIEVGNAILGSGGLSVAVDVIREFFGLVKDNLPAIQNLATVMGILVATRVAAWLAGLIPQAIVMGKSLLTMGQGAGAAAKGMAAARLAALGLTTAMYGALAIAGFLVVKWGAAAIKAAELTREAKKMNEAIAAGADPVDALIASLSEGEDPILNQDLIDTLHKYGISVRDFAQGMLEGRDVLTEMGATGKTWEERVQSLIRAQDRLGEAGVWLEIEGDMLRVRDAVNETSPLVEQFLDVKRSELRDVLIETGKAAHMTQDEMDALIDKGIEIFGIDVTGSEFGKWITGEYAIDGWMGQFEDMRDRINETADEEGSWIERLLDTEGGEEKVEEFFTNIGESIDNYKEHITERMNEITESIMSQFPAWDEYETVVIESLDAVLAAQDSFIEDLILATTLQAELEGILPPQAMDWFEALGIPTQAGMARYAESNPQAWQTFIDGLKENFSEVGEVIGGEMERELPEAQREAFATMLAEAYAFAESLELPGKDTAEAFADGLKERMAGLPAEHQDEFFGYLSETFQGGSLFGIGGELGQSLIDGLLMALGSMAVQAYGTIGEQAGRIRNALSGDFEVRSPSKFTYRLGTQLTEGLVLGMEQSMDSAMSRVRRTYQPAINQILNSTSHTTVNVPKQPVGDISLTYNNPHMNDYGRDLKRTQLILTDLVHLTESRFV